MGRSARRWLIPERGRGAGVLVRVVACAVVLCGCTGSPRDQPEEPAQAPLQIELATGVSDLSREERQELQRQVGDVLSDYVVDAFLGDYPRDDFVAALDSFTSRAAEKAARDLDQLTALRYGDAEEVRAQRLVARVSAFPADGDAAGATAHVNLRFVVDDGESAPVAFRVSGRLGLLPDQGSWRIFAYAVRRQQVPAAGGGDR